MLWTVMKMSMKVMSCCRTMVVTPFWKIDFVPCAALAGMGRVLENLTCWWKKFWQCVVSLLLLGEEAPLQNFSLKCG